MKSWVRALVSEASSTMRDDAGDDRVLGRAVDDHAERAGPVERAGEDLVADGLDRGQRFAGDRGLVDLAETLQHLTVGADPLAGPDQDDVADHEVGRVDDLLALRSTVNRVARSGARSSKPAHRVRGTPGDEGLERTGRREDDDQQGTVEDLPDRGRAAAPRRS